MSRTIRKKLTGAKAVSSNCRNHGTCDYCKGNRTHKHKRKGFDMKEESSIMTFDLENEDKPALLSLGARLALLQGVYDITFTELCACVEEKFGSQRSHVTPEEMKELPEE